MLPGKSKALWSWTALALLIASFGPSASATGPANLNKYTLSVDGVDRTYLYYVSSKAASFRGNWVVFALHDNGQTAEQFAEQSGWMKVAEENSFAVVFPQATNNVWTPSSGAEDNYLKAVFDHARTHLISRYPGDNTPVVGQNAAGGVGGSNNPIWAWEPLRDLTGVGAGATVAQEFAMNHPGLFAAVATLNGVAYRGAYDHAGEPAQAAFQHMRGKPIEPIWKQLKKDVPETVWMFTTGPEAHAQTEQAAYWKAADAPLLGVKKRTIDGYDTTIFENASNSAEQVRLTTLAASAKYDAAMSATIWNDLFAHVVRWTSSPNGDLVSVLTEAEVNKQFEVRTIDVGDGKPYTYYLKLPSTYKQGSHLPLVLSTHGANEAAWLFISKTKMHEVGEKEGFITVFPNGHKNRWDTAQPDGPDAKFLELMIKDVIATYGADPSHVYMQGFSNGSALTTMMTVTHPQLFAATSPTNAPGPLAPKVKARAEELMAGTPIRIPVMGVFGSVDSGPSVDGTLLAESMGPNAGIEVLKKFNNVQTKDRVEKFDSRYTDPYDRVVLQGKLAPQGIDKRYPAGRFQVYEYLSADPKPLNLVDIVWILDMPHAYDLREAQMQWNFFKHWQRNADGSLTYRAE